MNSQTPRIIDKDIQVYALDDPDVIFDYYRQGAYSHGEIFEKHAEKLVKSLKWRVSFIRAAGVAANCLLGMAFLAALLVALYQVWFFLYYGFWPAIDMFYVYSYLGWKYDFIVYPDSWHGFFRILRWWMDVNISFHMIAYGILVKISFMAVARKIYSMLLASI